jgi:hypothetical protein
MVSDPLGLLDRNLLDFSLAYHTFVADTQALDALAREWYRAFSGREPAPEDIAHGRWRASVERDRWRTIRRAFQEAWPLPAAPVPPGHALRLQPRGHYFVRENGERFTAIVCTDFNLQKILCDGGDSIPVIRQRRDCGFNMVRVFIVGDWGDPNYLCRPQDHQDYYYKLSRLAEILAAEGMYFMACAFCDTPRIFPAPQAQLDHWHRTCGALSDHQNVLLELVNENDVSVNTLDPSLFEKPDGILSSHGSNGSQALAVRPWWDFEVFHTNAAPEEQRKVGHNAMELGHGTPDWPASHVPVITNETSRYPEVGMWRNSDLERQKGLAFESAAGAALLCAGSCFHSVNGKLSRLWDANEEEVARAWAAGARSVPLEFQDGHYTASHLDGFPLDPGELRRYGRRLGDGRTHWVSIRE